MRYYPVTAELVNSVSFRSLCTLLDALHFIQTADVKHEHRIREAESRLEEVFGAYCTRPRAGTLVLDASATFGSLMDAYVTAADSLCGAFVWRADNEGPGFNRWVDLSSILERGIARIRKGE